MEIITENTKQTYLFGQKIGQEIIKSRKGRVICLYGELGSGKTTFTQGVAKGLGVGDFVLSPTFIIVRQYNLPVENKRVFFHIDLYRIENEGELTNIGLHEIFSNSDNIIVVEWAEKLGKFLPQKRIDIKFTILDFNRRKINFSYEDN